MQHWLNGLPRSANKPTDQPVGWAWGGGDGRCPDPWDFGRGGDLRTRGWTFGCKRLGSGEVHCFSGFAVRCAKCLVCDTSCKSAEQTTVFWSLFVDHLARGAVFIARDRRCNGVACGLWTFWLGVAAFGSVWVSCDSDLRVSWGRYRSCIFQSTARNSDHFARVVEHPG